MKDFQTMNPSRLERDGDRITIEAPPKTDFFIPPGPIPEEGLAEGAVANAPYYYQEITGDFVLRVQVEHDCLDVYDACAIMLMEAEDIWAKLCFETTDFGTNAIVSVVTNAVSDDANGVDIDGTSVWLQVARVGDLFGLHYSLDGETFNMVRYFYLPVSETLRVGLVAQSPLGRGGARHFDSLTIEARSVADLRAGK